MKQSARKNILYHQKGYVRYSPGKGLFSEKKQKTSFISEVWGTGKMANSRRYHLNSLAFQGLNHFPGSTFIGNKNIDILGLHK